MFPVLLNLQPASTSAGRSATTAGAAAEIPFFQWLKSSGPVPAGTPAEGSREQASAAQSALTATASWLPLLLGALVSSAAAEDAAGGGQAEAWMERLYTWLIELEQAWNQAGWETGPEESGTAQGLPATWAPAMLAGLLQTLSDSSLAAGPESATEPLPVAQLLQQWLSQHLPDPAGLRTPSPTGEDVLTTLLQSLLQQGGEAKGHLAGDGRTAVPQAGQPVPESGQDITAHQVMPTEHPSGGDESGPQTAPQRAAVQVAQGQTAIQAAGSQPVFSAALARMAESAMGTLPEGMPTPTVRVQVQPFENLMGKGFEVTFRLHPESLGSLSVRMVLHQGVLQAQLMADSLQAKEVLQAQVQSLKEALVQQGWSLDRLQITILDKASLPWTGQGGWQNQPGFQQQARQHARRGHEEGGAWRQAYAQEESFGSLLEGIDTSV